MRDTKPKYKHTRCSLLYALNGIPDICFVLIPPTLKVLLQYGIQFTNKVHGIVLLCHSRLITGQRYGHWSQSGSLQLSVDQASGSPRREGQAISLNCSFLVVHHLKLYSHSFNFVICGALCNRMTILPFYYLICRSDTRACGHVIFSQKTIALLCFAFASAPTFHIPSKQDSYEK